MLAASGVIFCRLLLMVNLIRGKTSFVSSSVGFGMFFVVSMMCVGQI
jgi:hypothetical protein